MVLMSFVRSSVHLSVCQRDNRKTAALIFMKLDGRVEHGPRKETLNYGAPPNHEMDTRAAHSKSEQFCFLVSVLCTME